MPRVAFILLAGVGLSYFALKKRRFDGYSLAFVSACVYFMPGFAGFSMYPSPSGLSPTPLVPQTYGVFAAVLTSVLIGGLAADLLPTLRIRSRVSIPLGGFVPLVALAIGLLGLIGSLGSTGAALLSTDKAIILDQLTRWHILWAAGAAIGAVTAYAEGRPLVFGACLALLAADVFVGFRSTAAITVIAVFTLWLSDRGSSRLLLKNIHVLALGALIAGGFFVYKWLYIAIKVGNWDLVRSRLADVQFYQAVLATAEPFVTQAVLNEVVKNGWEMDPGHFGALVYKFIVFSQELGAEQTSFNSLAQPELFPFARGGVASNIWAEMWSSGGWPLLIIFLIVFLAVLGFLGRGITVTQPAMRGIMSLLLAYWAFYIHRNDLSYTIDLWRRVIGVFVVAGSISMLITRVGHSGSRSPERPTWLELGRREHEDGHDSVEPIPPHGAL
jgi:hypothetical protein